MTIGISVHEAYRHFDEPPKYMAAAIGRTFWALVASGVLRPDDARGVYVYVPKRARAKPSTQAA